MEYPTGRARPHYMFFYNDGTHIFRAGQYLFKVHASVLADKSESFRDMFGANLEATTHQIDGQSEDSPILIPPSVSEMAFELFISVCYNKWRPDTADITDDVIIQLLDLSRQYICQDARNYAIQRLFERRISIRPSRLLSVSMEYNLVQLFTFSFERLVKAKFENLTPDEYTLVGPVVWAHVLKAKERIRFHQHIVACEPPPMVHVTACANNGQCTDDWKQLWWNGMGRFLLDGRNPQPYKDAIQRFEDMDIGRVSVECWKVMMVVVRKQSAFRHEEKFIERTADALADRLLDTTGFTPL